MGLIDVEQIIDGEFGVGRIIHVNPDLPCLKARDGNYIWVFGSSLYPFDLEPDSLLASILHNRVGGVDPVSNNSRRLDDRHYSSMAEAPVVHIKKDDVSDFVTSATIERRNYIRDIEAGKVEITGRREFDSGEFVLNTVDNRMFYGRDGTLEGELDPVTLEARPDEVLSCVRFADFKGSARSKGSGGSRRRRHERKIHFEKSLMPSFLSAVANIALGEKTAENYTGFFTDGKHDSLLDVEQVRESFGSERALSVAVALIAEYSNKRGFVVPKNGAVLYMAMVDVVLGRRKAVDYVDRGLGAYEHHLKNAERVCELCEDAMSLEPGEYLPDAKVWADPDRALGWVHDYMRGLIEDDTRGNFGKPGTVRDLLVSQKDPSHVSPRVSECIGLPKESCSYLPKAPGRALMVYTTMVGPHAAVTFVGRR